MDFLVAYYMLGMMYAIGKHSIDRHESSYRLKIGDFYLTVLGWLPLMIIDYCAAFGKDVPVHKN